MGAVVTEKLPAPDQSPMARLLKSSHGLVQGCFHGPVAVFRMVTIGAHLINKGEMDGSICASIHRQSALIPGVNTFYGTGVYAYYADHVPCEYRNSPFVVFEPLPLRGWIELRQIMIPGIAFGESPTPVRRFFLLPGAAGKPIKVALLGFVNCPASLPKYPGVLYYV